MLKMRQYFNLPRYKKLFELNKNEKFSFFDQNFQELLIYKSNIEDQFYYDKKKDYFLLIDEYLSCVISTNYFQFKFLQMQKEHFKSSSLILEDFQALEGFNFAENLEEFSDLINEISTLCFEYNEVWDGTIEPMSENEFYYLVNNLYSQFQKNFPLENLNK